MSDSKQKSLADALREKFLDDVSAKIECDIITISGAEFEYCWRPMTGSEQREIQQYASKSIAEGICAHIKVRAIDRSGNKLFAGVPITSMMNDFNFKDDLLPMFEKMAGGLDIDDIKKN